MTSGTGHSDQSSELQTGRILEQKEKKEYISKIKGFKKMTVCEDEMEAYEYWQKHFNYNPDNCCNLKICRE